MEGLRAGRFLNYLRMFRGLDAEACVVVLHMQFECVRVPRVLRLTNQQLRAYTNRHPHRQTNVQNREVFAAWLRAEKRLQHQGVTQTVAAFREQLQAEHPADCLRRAGGGGAGMLGLHVLTPLEIVKFLDATQARREARVVRCASAGYGWLAPMTTRLRTTVIAWYRIKFNAHTYTAKTQTDCWIPAYLVAFALLYLKALRAGASRRGASIEPVVEPLIQL